MPKPIKESDRILLASLQYSAEYALASKSDHEVYTEFGDRRHLVEQMSAIAIASTQAEHSHAYNYLINLLRVARFQTLCILDGACQFLEHHDYTQTEVLHSLSDTSDLAVKFGRIGGRHENSRPVDDYLARQCLKSPLEYFTYNNVTHRVEFSDTAQAFIAQHTSRETGCPAMSIPITRGDTKTTLYQFSWQQTAEEFLDCYSRDVGTKAVLFPQEDTDD